MNILLLNQDWFAQELRAAGHRVMTAGTREHMQARVVIPGEPFPQFVVRALGDFRPDRIVVFDESAPLLFSGLEDAGVPMVFYSVDVHHHADIHRYTAHAFDAVLVAQPDYLPRFAETGVAAQWMPLWASRWVEPSPVKQHGAVFVGSMNPSLNPERVQFFAALERRVPILVTTGAWWEIFARSELIVNQTVKGDLNFRVFEAMMSGGLLLTEECNNGLSSLFQSGRHLVTYRKNDIDDAAGKIGYYLSHQSACRELAAAGRAEILRAHCPAHRAQFLLSLLEGLQIRKKRWRFFSLTPNFVWAATALAKVSQELQVHALEIAMGYIARGMREDPVPDSDLSAYLITACLEYDRLTSSGAGSRMIERLGERWPELPMVHVAKIWLLLEKGERQRAEQYALTFSGCPLPDTITHVKNIISTLTGRPILECP